MDEPTEITENSPSFMRELVTFAILAIVIVVPIRLFIAQPFIVNGESMATTFTTSDYLIIDQISYRFNDPERGDVIVFRFPEDPSKFFIKRIIGLPGETVEIVGNDIYIEKQGGREKLNEPYVTMNIETFSRTVLGDTEYFTMGDNRLASLDSRSWGPLDRRFIIGRAYVKLLPIKEIGILPGGIK